MWKERLQEALQRLSTVDGLWDVAAAGEVPALWQVQPLQERRYSRIYVLEPRHEELRRAIGERLESDALVLKLYHAVQAERRQQEFDDLQRVQSLCGTRTNGSVVRPVAVFADLGVVVTARAAGQAADVLTQRASMRGAPPDVMAESAALCTRAGVWLQSFQEEQAPLQGAASPHLATVDAFVDYVDARLQIMQSRPFPLPEALRERTRRALHAALDADELGSVVWSHSDFGPHNLLGDASHVTVLDFELMPQHPWFDAAYFIESLAGFSGWRYAPDHVTRLQRVFLSGYGLQGDEALFTALRIRHLVCTAASLRARRSRLPFLSWWDMAHLRHRLGLLVQALETAAPRRQAQLQPA